MYKVLSGDDPAALTLIVERHLAQGWRPLGGVAVVRWEIEKPEGYTEMCWEFYQAVVKDAPLDIAMMKAFV